MDDYIFEEYILMLDRNHLRASILCYLVIAGIPMAETAVRMYTNRHRCDGYAVFVVSSLYGWTMAVSVAPYSEVLRPVFNVLTIVTNIIIWMSSIHRSRNLVRPSSSRRCGPVGYDIWRLSIFIPI
jgi:hypothetical protein